MVLKIYQESEFVCVCVCVCVYFCECVQEVHYRLNCVPQKDLMVLTPGTCERGLFFADEINLQ